MFCNVCGQASDVGRYAVNSFLHEVYQSVRKVDFTATFTTSIELLRYPGLFVREFLAGKRVGYINPIKFYFYGFIADYGLRSVLTFFTGDVTYHSRTDADTTFQIIGLVSTAFWGVLWKLLYRRTQMNSVEFAAAAIFFEAETNVLASAAMLILSPIKAYSVLSDQNLALIELVIEVGYAFYFAKSLFGESIFKTAIKQFALTAIYIFLLAFLLLKWMGTS